MLLENAHNNVYGKRIYENSLNKFMNTSGPLM